MAYYNDISHRSDLIERVLARGANLFAQAAARRATHRVYLQTLSELKSLSERELADLGMHRSELKRIAWASTYGKTGL